MQDSTIKKTVEGKVIRRGNVKNEPQVTLNISTIRTFFFYTTVEAMAK